MIYIAVVEHPLNDFKSMDPRIFLGIIKPMVIDPIKNDVQTIFGEIEQNLQLLSTIVTQMRENKSNAALTQKLSE